MASSSCLRKRRNRSHGEKNRYVHFGSVDVLVTDAIILVPQVFFTSSKDERSSWLPIRQPMIQIKGNEIFNVVTFELDTYEALMHRLRQSNPGDGEGQLLRSPPLTRKKKKESLRLSLSWPSLHQNSLKRATARTMLMDQQDRHQLGLLLEGRLKSQHGLDFPLLSSSPPPPPPPFCKLHSGKSRKRHHESALESIEDSLSVLDARINQLSRMYPLKGGKEAPDSPEPTTRNSIVVPSASITRRTEPFRSRSAKCA